MVVQWIIKHLLSILAGAAVIVIIVVAIYLGVEFSSTSDDYKYLASDSSVAGKKEQFYTEYIEQEEANQEAIASGDSTAGTSLTGGNGGSTSSGSSVSLNATEEQVKAILAANGYSDAEQTSLTMIYSVLHDNGYPDAAFYGFMANSNSEGTIGLFQDSKDNIIGKTLSEWPSSGGVGCIQWTGSRSTTLKTFYEQVMTEYGLDPSSNIVTEEVAYEAEKRMFANEISPTNSASYYKDLKADIEQNSSYTFDNATVECWTEAVCDRFEKPGGCCLYTETKGVYNSPLRYLAGIYPDGSKNYMGTEIGSACKTRVSVALDIAEMFGGK